jgi:hypothetical protein
MATIRFKAKPRPFYNMDDTLAYQTIAVPQFTSAHYDIAEFRCHPKYQGLANSQLFPNVLSRIRRDTFQGRDHFRLDRIPGGVTVDLSGFLAVVSFDV